MHTVCKWSTVKLVCYGPQLRYLKNKPCTSCHACFNFTRIHSGSPTLHSDSTLSYMLHDIDLCEIFECTHLKLMVSVRSKQTNQQTNKHTHTHAQCGHASVGLAQARPNEHLGVWLCSYIQDIKLDDCEKQVQTDCNIVTIQSINLILTSAIHIYITSYGPSSAIIWFVNHLLTSPTIPLSFNKKNKELPQTNAHMLPNEAWWNFEGMMHGVSVLIVKASCVRQPERLVSSSFRMRKRRENNEEIASLVLFYIHTYKHIYVTVLV